MNGGTHFPLRGPTLGKTATLELGMVVTDVGAGIANGEPCPYIRRCRGDDGLDYIISVRIIEELPETLRRAELPAWIY